MNQIIIFCAEYLVFITIAYVIFLGLKENNKVSGLKKVAFIFLTALISWFIAHILKDVFKIPRPETTIRLITADGLYGFPSGHSSFMFSIFFSMFFFYRKESYMILLFAILTGVGRVLSGVHSISDIIGGAILGGLVAVIFIQIYKSLKILH